MRTVDTKKQTEKARKTLEKKGYSFVKLTEKQATDIRYLLKNKILTQQEVCAKYKISLNIVYRIVKNISYTKENPTWLKRLPNFGKNPSQTRTANQ